jgi:small subunit ribosomal protein S1
LRSGDQVSLEDAIGMMRVMLEGSDLLAILESEDFFVHIGYDMYVWIGSHMDCVKGTAEAQRIGLFVEPGIVSPNLKPRPDL